MQPHVVPPSSPGRRIGLEGQFAHIASELGALVTHFETCSAQRRRVWWGESARVAVGPMVPTGAAAILRWDVVRHSRDQLELAYSHRDRAGVVQWLGCFIATVDDCGLHLALSIENSRAMPLSARIGFQVQLAAQADALLAVPPGSLGGGCEARSDTSPFSWPRRSILTHRDGDQIEVRAQSPLSRTEVRRQADHVTLNLLAPSPLAAGATLRLECRLRATLDGSQDAERVQR